MGAAFYHVWRRSVLYPGWLSSSRNCGRDASLGTVWQPGTLVGDAGPVYYGGGWGAGGEGAATRPISIFRHPNNFFVWNKYNRRTPVLSSISYGEDTTPT